MTDTLSVLVLSDYDSRIKWGVSLARRLTEPKMIDVVLRPHQAGKVERYLMGVRTVLFDDRPLDFLRNVSLADYDIVVVALGGGANVKVVGVVQDRIPAGGRRPLLVGGFNGLTDSEDPDVILSRVGLDLVTVNCRKDYESFQRFLKALGADGPRLLISGYMREYPDVCDLGSTSGKNEILFVQQDGVPKSAKAFAYLIEKLQAFVLAHPHVRLAIKLRDENRIGMNRNNAGYNAKRVVQEVLAGDQSGGRIWLDCRDVEDSLQSCDEVWSISSTVMLEALLQGKHVVSISDFGISRYLGNAPLIGSNLFVRLDDLACRKGVVLDPVWKSRNLPPPISTEQLKIAVVQELERLRGNSWRFHHPYYLSSPWVGRKNGLGLSGLLGIFARRLIWRNRYKT